MGKFCGHRSREAEINFILNLNLMYTQKKNILHGMHYPFSDLKAPKGLGHTCYV